MDLSSLASNSNKFIIIFQINYDKVPCHKRIKPQEPQFSLKNDNKYAKMALSLH